MEERPAQPLASETVANRMAPFQAPDRRGLLERLLSRIRRMRLQALRNRERADRAAGRRGGSTLSDRVFRLFSPETIALGLVLTLVAVHVFAGLSGDNTSLLASVASATASARIAGANAHAGSGASTAAGAPSQGTLAAPAASVPTDATSLALGRFSFNLNDAGRGRERLFTFHPTPNRRYRIAAGDFIQQPRIEILDARGRLLATNSYDTRDPSVASIPVWRAVSGDPIWIQITHAGSSVESRHGGPRFVEITPIN